MLPISEADSVQPSTLADLRLRAVLTIAMALPMLIVYAIGTLGPFLVNDLHIQPGLLGYMTMSTFGFAAILSPWAGPMVDRLGSQRALGTLFFAVALAYLLIVTIPGFSGVVAAVAVCGIAQALANPVTNLLIAQCVAPQKRAFVVGLKQCGVHIAALFAGLALPGIALQFGWRAALGIIIPIALVLAITAPSVAPSSLGGKVKRFHLSRPNVLLLLLMSSQCCAGISLSAFITFLPIFATQQGMLPSQAGLLVAVFGAMGIFSRLVLPPLGARLRDESPLLLALLAMSAIAIAVTMQADSTNHWKLWMGAVGMGLTAVATNAIAMSMLLRDAAFGAVTAASGLLSSAFFGGFALGPPAYGAISDTTHGFTGAWSALIGVVLLGCLMAIALTFVRHRKAQ